MSIQKCSTKMASFIDKINNCNAGCIFASRSMAHVRFIWKGFPCLTLNWPKLSKSLLILGKNCSSHMIRVLYRWWSRKEVRTEGIPEKGVPFTGMNSLLQPHSHQMSVFSQPPGMSKQATLVSEVFKISGKEMSTKSQLASETSSRDSMLKIKWSKMRKSARSERTL